MHTSQKNAVSFLLISLTVSGKNNVAILVPNEIPLMIIKRYCKTKSVTNPLAFTAHEYSDKSFSGPCPIWFTNPIIAVLVNGCKCFLPPNIMFRV